jgi:hypothetical protein
VFLLVNFHQEIEYKILENSVFLLQIWLKISKFLLNFLQILGIKKINYSPKNL